METLLTRDPLPPDSESQEGTVIDVVIVALSIATVFASLRLYSRKALLKEFGADDWTAIIAWVFTLGTGVVLVLCTTYGLGYHASTLQPETLLQFNQVFFVFCVLYNTSVGIIKAAFFLQYRRAFAPSPIMQKICIIGIILAICWGIAQVCFTVFNCSPPAASWNPYVKDDCAAELPLWYATLGVNTFTDLALICLPLPLLSRLHLGLGQKSILVAVFSLGFFTCAISFIRMSTLKQGVSATDLPWDGVATACWSVIELAGGLTCLCVPTLRPVMFKFWPQPAPSHPNDSPKSPHGHAEPDHVDAEHGRVGEGRREPSFQVGEDDEFEEVDLSVDDEKAGGVVIRSAEIYPVAAGDAGTKLRT